VHFRGESSEAWMERTGDRYWVRTRDREGRLGDYPVSWVIGGKRMQDPITTLSDGRWQVLPVYYHVTGGGEWVDYNEARQGRVTPDHPFFWTNFRRSANHECLDCHVTGLEVRYERATHTWSTRFVDAGVACESCHGPGARHAETKDARDIVQPRKVDAETGLAICAQCHGPRNPVFPLLDARHRYRPGRRYEDYYDAYVITVGTPERSLDFFADGRPSSGSFEYQALLQSACYRKGGATCLTCHTAPHEEHGRDDLKLSPGDGAPLADQSCRSCHAPLFASEGEHSHHLDPKARSCVSCHMPRVVPAVLDMEADHSIDIPVPENTARHGVPNACGTCHAKETPAALAESVRRWWPGAGTRQKRRLRLADAFDIKPSERTRPALAAVASDRGEAPTLRGAAALLLAQADPRQAVPVLVPMLRDGSDIVRLKAAMALGLCGAREAASDLLPLLRERSLAVRQAAALALASFGSPEGERALRALTDDPEASGLVQPQITLAVLEGRRGDFAAAAARLERTLPLKPYNVATLIALADTYGRLGRRADARAAIEEALRFDPLNPAVRMRQARFAQ
jgi:HEAT repeat protein/tetratricopeptide repeat protein/cytochrome c554/c'-like protein